MSSKFTGKHRSKSCIRKLCPHPQGVRNRPTINNPSSLATSLKMPPTHQSFFRTVFLDMRQVWSLGMAASDALQSWWFRIELSPGPSTESSVTFWRRGSCKQQVGGNTKQGRVVETNSASGCPPVPLWAKTDATGASFLGWTFLLWKPFRLSSLLASLV